MASKHLQVCSQERGGPVIYNIFLLAEILGQKFKRCVNFSGRLLCVLKVGITASLFGDTDQFHQSHLHFLPHCLGLFSPFGFCVFVLSPISNGNCGIV